MEEKKNEVINVNKSSENQVNKVSAKKAVAQTKINKNILDDMLSRFAKNGTLKAGSKGVKSEIYRKELFTDMLDDEKKYYRKKLRKALQGFIGEFRSAKDLLSRQKIARDFWEFYSTTYTCNDFTVASVAGGKIDDNTRAIYEKTLPEIKKVLKK